MTGYKLLTPDRTKDLLFEECDERRRLEDIFTKLYKSRGFSEVVTPGIEYIDVFNFEENGSPLESMYKLFDNNGRILALRPDSTIPIARLCATRLKHHTQPIKLFYDQSIYMVNRSLSGRMDEYVQCGVEIIGAKGSRADLEVVATAIETLNRCDVPYSLEIGHIGVFNLLTQKLSVSDEIKSTIKRLTQQKNYPALNDILDTITCEDKYIKVLKRLPRLFGGAEIFAEAKNLIDDDEIGALIDYLQSVYENLIKLPMNGKISVDLGLTNHTGYYTGIVFSGYISGIGEQVLSGGRYDTLVSNFGINKKATGFGVNVDALARYTGSNAAPGSAVQTLVFAEKGYETQALKFLTEITNKGVTAEYSLFDTLDETKKYALAKGIEKIEVIG